MIRPRKYPETGAPPHCENAAICMIFIEKSVFVSRSLREAIIGPLGKIVVVARTRACGYLEFSRAKLVTLELRLLVHLWSYLLSEAQQNVDGYRQCAE
jgi:hypothetical protein